MRPLDLREFWLALTAPGREIIAFAARQELVFCLRNAGRLPEAVFDPQIAAGLVGFGYPLSHTNFVRRLFGVRVAGSEAYTDWGKRPLNSQQLRYAADDVRHLIESRQKLVELGQSMGRLDWLNSEFQALVDTVRKADQEERWWKTPGISRMDGRVLAVLRALWRWRDGRARDANLPPRRVLGDDLMLEIAKRGPRSVGNLFALRGMDRPALRKAGRKWSTRSTPASRCPEKELSALIAMVRHDDPPQVTVLGQLLAILTSSLAAEHQVAGSMLATTADLQAVRALAHRLHRSGTAADDRAGEARSSDSRSSSCWKGSASFTWSTSPRRPRSTSIASRESDRGLRLALPTGARPRLYCAA